MYYSDNLAFYGQRFYGPANRTYLRPKLFHAVLACLLFCSLAHAVGTYQPYSHTSVHSDAGLSSAPKQPPITSRTAAASSASAAGAATSVPQNSNTIVPPCAANTAYAPPAALDLSSAANGLTEVIDQPAYYRVYGLSVSQVANELNACAPHFPGTVAGAHYLAYTSYHLSWQYNYLTTAGGQCVLSDVKIGMHVSQIFPQWGSSSVATAAIRNKWQSFSAALVYHESGHVALNTQYANKLLADLNALPPMNCSDVSSIVNATINADIAALNAAHLQHDETTGYGATEGAVWQ